MDPGPAGLGLWDGYFLNGVLEFGSGRLKQFCKIGPVQEFERCDAIGAQPPLQQPTNPVPGVGGIDVLRRHTKGLYMFPRLFFLTRHLFPKGEDRDGLKFP